MLKKKDLPDCTVAVTVNVIGGKWKLLIIQALSTGPKRFSELQTALSGVSKKVLSASLRAMMEDGIVNRDVTASMPVSVEYKLNEMGKSLQPILDAMDVWGQKYKQWRLQLTDWKNSANQF